MTCSFWGYLAPRSPLLEPPQNLDYRRDSMSNVLGPVDWSKRARAKELGRELIQNALHLLPHCVLILSPAALKMGIVACVLQMGKVEIQKG